MPRIVSLIASSTEILCALGFSREIVGISHECDFPESIRGLPVTTETKFIADGTSYEIDQRIKAILQEGLSVYRVKGELLKSLRPDVIVTQTQCEVCAVSEKDVEAATCSWLESRPKIVSLHPDCLADLWKDIRRVAGALDAVARGEILISALSARISEIGARAAALAERPRVACIEWFDPLMAAGNWVPELVELAGGVNLFGQAGKHSPWMKWEDVLAADPDILIGMPCGFDIARTLKESPALLSRPGWADLRAVRDRQVFAVDGNQYFNRPGPRLVESLEILAEILHPGRFDFGHRGKGYQAMG
jgi:iron complex transport system substrate-binding protein